MISLSSELNHFEPAATDSPSNSVARVVSAAVDARHNAVQELAAALTSQLPPPVTVPSRATPRSPFINSPQPPAYRLALWVPCTKALHPLQWQS